MDAMTYEFLFRKMGCKQDINELSEADTYRRMERAHILFFRDANAHTGSDLYDELRYRVAKTANRLQTAIIDYNSRYNTPEEIKEKLKAANSLLSDPTYEKVIEAVEVCREALKDVKL